MTTSSRGTNGNCQFLRRVREIYPISDTTTELPTTYFWLKLWAELFILFKKKKFVFFGFILQESFPFEKGWNTEKKFYWRSSKKHL